MQISGTTIPFNAMQAYGIKNACCNPAASTKTISTTQRAEQTRDIAIVGSIRPSAGAAPTSAASGAKLQSLVGAKVPGPVSFESVGQVRPTNAPSLTLYTRAADRIEAAVAVNVGRAIDLRG